jgi:hypothetical protein
MNLYPVIYMTGYFVLPIQKKYFIYYKGNGTNWLSFDEDDRNHNG